MTRAERIAKSFDDARNSCEWRQAASAAHNFAASGGMTRAERADLLRTAQAACDRIWAHAANVGKERPALRVADLFDADPWGSQA
jgi:hypothetical protein